jgi:peptidyl-prolyl cis-trans isomerase C/foldase protein PrsA
LAALLLAGCPESKKPEPAMEDSSVASVDGRAISRQEFERELAQEIDLGGSAPPSLSAEALKRSVLESMFERFLLLRAAKDANVSVSTEELDRELLRLRADYPGERFNEALAQGRLSLADLRDKTAALLTIQKLFREQVYPRVAVTEEEIRVYYEDHSEDFQRPEEVRAAQIVVKTGQEARAIEQQLRAGKDFGEMARKYSLSPDAKLGGDLGFFARGQMPRQFDDVAFRLKVNQVSNVVSTNYGFHIFKLLAKRPARNRPLSEVKGQIEQKLVGEKREQAQAEYVKMLRDKAVIKVNEATLASTATGASPGK